MTGSKGVSVPFRDLVSKLTHSVTKAHNMDNWWRVAYCSNRISQYIATYLFNNSSVWLNLKRVLADELRQTKFTRRNYELV